MTSTITDTIVNIGLADGHFYADRRRSHETCRRVRADQPGFRDRDDPAGVLADAVGAGRFRTPRLPDTKCHAAFGWSARPSDRRRASPTTAGPRSNLRHARPTAARPAA